MLLVDVRRDRCAASVRRVGRARDRGGAVVRHRAAPHQTQHQAGGADSEVGQGKLQKPWLAGWVWEKNHPGQALQIDITLN